MPRPRKKGWTYKSTEKKRHHINESAAKSLNRKGLQAREKNRTRLKIWEIVGELGNMREFLFKGMGICESVFCFTERDLDLNSSRGQGSARINENSIPGWFRWGQAKRTAG